MMEHHLKADQAEGWLPLQRRNLDLGYVRALPRRGLPDAAQTAIKWRNDEAIFLPDMLNLTAWQADIAQAHRLMEATLERGECSHLFEADPYRARLSPHFPLIATSFEEHDEQGIEKIYFDAEVDEHGERTCVAEELWCKASWLSFIEEDASLRFRFSFGMECLEDVASDPSRQQWAAQLCDAIFPESIALTGNSAINGVMREILGGPPAYVERIVYFNAPNGGAQMHHDVERGHDGVVFAQLSGSTCWLALAKPLLIDQIRAFVADPDHEAELQRLLPDAADRDALKQLCSDRDAMAAYMDEFDHELVEAVMDRSPLFIHQLAENGYGYILQPGDLLLMPQRNMDSCVWHCVTALGDEPGEALSFAVRKSV